MYPEKNRYVLDKLSKIFVLYTTECENQLGY